jgi:RimJ/RimL family protein N-acetyltransferase
MELTFTSFRPSDLAEYASWFDEKETATRLSHPDAAWLAHVMGASGAWAVRDEAGALIAVVEAEEGHSDRCYVSVTVEPSRRGKGIGAKAIKQFHGGPGAHFAVLEGRVAPHNIQSVSMLQKAGFRLMAAEPDADGMLRFELRKPGR